MKYLTLLLVLISQFGFTQNHLEPANSFFDVFDYQYTYYKKVKEVLFKDLADNPKIRMVVFPSFAKEYVIQIEEDTNLNNNYSIIINEPIDKSIWSHNEGNTVEEIKTKTYKSTMSGEDLNILYELLHSAIIKTKFRTDNMSGMDGTTYYLSIWDTGLKSAEIWSPSDKNLKELIFIMETVVDKAKSEKEISFSKKLKNSILALTKKFNKKLSKKEMEFLFKFDQSISKIKGQYPLFMEISESFPIELEMLYENIEESINLVGIQYAEIDKIILQHKKTYDRNSFVIIRNNKEFEKLLKDDNPFLKLIQTYKSDL